MGIIANIKNRIVKSFLSGYTQESPINSNYYGGRGFQVISSNEIIKLTALDKHNKERETEVQLKYSSVDPMIALQVYQKCSPVFGIVNKRAFRVSSTNWDIIPVKKIEDEIAVKLKDAHSIYKEYEGDSSMESIRIQLESLKLIYSNLPTVRNDLSNFDSALFRTMRQIRHSESNRCNEIEDFLAYPSPGLSMSDLLKIIVSDLQVHGRIALVKQILGDGKLGNIKPLSGGTVYPIKTIYASNSVEGYVQIVDSLESPQVFFSDEIMFSHYMPNSAVSYGMTPIDAMINLMTEFLYFEEQGKNKADGNEPPQKLIVFGQPNEFGQEDGSETIDPDEQRRVENKLNRNQKRKAIATLTGYGTPISIDLSNNDIYNSLMQRQEQILKFVAIAFSASNNEINDNNDNLATSKVNERYDYSSGIAPIYGTIEDMFNYEYLNYKYGGNYIFKFNPILDEKEKFELAKLKKDSGLMDINEIRVKDLGLEPYPESDYSRPSGANPQQETLDVFNSIKGKIGK